MKERKEVFEKIILAPNQKHKLILKKLTLWTVTEICYFCLVRDVYDYFRAVLKMNEKSERVLELTVDALALNPANYTVWQYR